MTNQEAMETLNRMAAATDRFGDIEREACELGVRVLLTTTPRPIETAPKDGTHILAVAEDKEWTVVYYKQTHSTLEERWRIHRCSGTHLIKPTHWLPLPKSPEVRR